MWLCSLVIQKFVVLVDVTGSDASGENIDGEGPQTPLALPPCTASSSSAHKQTAAPDGKTITTNDCTSLTLNAL